MTGSILLVAYQQTFDTWHFWVDTIKIEFLNAAFGGFDQPMKTFIVGEAVIVCTYMEISKF